MTTTKSKTRDILEWIAIAAIVIFWISFLFWQNFSIIRNTINSNKLNKNGLVIKGKVLESTTTNTHRGEGYSLKYSYTVKDKNGEKKTFTKKQKVDANTSLFADLSDDVEIVYLKEKPRVSKVKGDHGRIQSTVIIILIDLIIIIGGFVLWRKEKKKKKAHNSAG